MENLVALTLTPCQLEVGLSFLPLSLEWFKTRALETSRSDVVGVLVALHTPVDS